MKKITETQRREIEALVNHLYQGFAPFVCTRLFPSKLVIESSSFTDIRKRELAGYANQLSEVHLFVDSMIKIIRSKKFSDPDVASSFFILGISEVLIHELSHVQQDIEFKRYVADNDYYKFIESTNEAMTAKLMLDNVETIADVLVPGVPSDIRSKCISEITQYAEMRKQEIKEVYGVTYDEALAEYQFTNEIKTVKRLLDFYFGNSSIKSFAPFERIIIDIEGNKFDGCDRSVLYELFTAIGDSPYSYKAFTVGGDAYVIVTGMSIAA